MAAPPSASVALRPAGPEHGQLLLEWRGDPEMRAASFARAELTPEEHAGWLVRTLADPNARLFVVEREGSPVGHLWLLRRGDEAEVRIGLVTEARDPAVARRALELAAGVARDELGVATLWSAASRDDESSIETLRAAGFDQEAHGEAGEEDLQMRRSV